MKNKTYQDFWQDLHKNARKERILLRVMFELTYSCNFKCRHCYLPPSYIKKYQKTELGTGEIFSILEQLRDIGCFYLGFTGGEPFLRKDFMQILWHAKKCGFQIIIYTNGSLIDKKVAGELKYIRPNKIDITIPAMSNKVFESITNVMGSQRKVFRAIRFLHKNGINLGFKSCLLKENKSEVDKIRNFAASLNIPHRLSDVLLPCLDSPQPLKICEKRYCGVGQMQAAITPSGELKMCVMRDNPKYEILRTSLRGCWEKLKKSKRI